ncbi:Benzyl alcohol O-benzoyltransferase [Dichanthelium oligosanthes]|uniref:Benzyl alcohol O-benzoyltransferase n=1 Tax=Dichanthelium oligosanthes TaxID=888268 RepID=A0A1E5WDW6_9POAL|nr:Benzyl alcohol O-benzoyltransferase [Dichanthelium oligosanthes]
MVSFKARRREPELVSPARPTPRETKALSDIDDQHALRYYETVIGFFRRFHGHSDGPEDLPKVVRAALAETLVYYYPVAGRLREEAGAKLVVDCTAEGVVFVEADADVRLEDFGEPLLPPYPCVEELLCDPGDTKDVIGRPLLLMQLTQLKCGGFVAGFHMCHSIADGFGIIQLMITIAEMACGAEAPSILPVWKREILSTRRHSSPTPAITYPNPSYEPLLNSLDYDSDDVMLSTPLEEMVVDYFVFGPREIKALESHVRGYLAPPATSFELLTAVMWRCRTIALGYKSSQPVRLMITMNARGRWNRHTLIPWGYYGNAHFSPIVELTVDELCRQPLLDTIELVRRTKLSVTKECMESMVETIASLRERPCADPARMYEVSDTKWIAAGNGLQLGWAEYVGGGIPVAGDLTSKVGSDHMRCKNQDGEDSTVVSMLLPRPAMERFTKEMSVWLNKHDEKNLIIQSSL